MTLEHSLDMLKELTMLAPQFVALSPLDGSVIGYTLTIDPRGAPCWPSQRGSPRLLRALLLYD